MIEWNEQHLMIRDMMRRFIDAEIKPHLHAFEHEGKPPYDVLRKLVKTFGMDEMSRQRFAHQIEQEKSGKPAKSDGDRHGGGDAGMTVIPIIELCRWCPGMVTAFGVSIGLTANAIMSKGTTRQKERWALDILTFDKIGAWAITEPNSGSDAFGSMKSTARRDGSVVYGRTRSRTDTRCALTRCSA